MTLINDEQRRIVLRERFTNHLINSFVLDNYQDASRSIPKIFSDFDFTDMTKFEMKKISILVRQEINKKWSVMWESISDELEQYGIGEANSTARIYNKYITGTFSMPGRSSMLAAFDNAFMILTSGKINRAGVWLKFVKENIDNNIKLIDGLIKVGWQDGLTNQALITQLRGKFDRKKREFVGGILNDNLKGRASVLVRTGTSHYSAVARDKLINSNRDIIKARILYATFDSRTSAICIARHLMEWDIDDKTYPRLPFHFNERSIYLFRLDDDQPFPGKRSSKGSDGGMQVDANLTFDQWLRRQDRSFIQETLGIRKSELFLDEGFKLERFTDATQKPLTLKEILGT